MWRFRRKLAPHILASNEFNKKRGHEYVSSFFIKSGEIILAIMYHLFIGYS
jgi:hypothetical protein